ncbi:hypothetical protein [Streptomyces sp. cmx-18-6]|uniref:hypothetical protein n=1 Tax=Streptomyces sp. cmx-18-6 TaxID=2790930 RepID=UPI003980BDC2
MTTDSITAVEAEPWARVHAVRHRYARCGDRAGAHDWLWGQARTVRDNLSLVAALAAAAIAVALIGRPAIVGGLWLLSGGPAVGAGVLGRPPSGPSAQSISPGSPASRRARPRPRPSPGPVCSTTRWTCTVRSRAGLTSALVRPDGRLRGHLAQGAVRALRTRGRAIAAAAFLLPGGAVLTLGVAEPEARLATFSWVFGAVAVYWGSGWVGETWRGLRDERTQAPLLGEWWGGMLARTLAWPVVAVAAAVGLASGVTALPRWPLLDRRAADALLLVAGSVVLVLGARFLREMKMNLPVELLLPVITPLGDLSGLRVFVWQFDGLVVVLIGLLVMNEMPTAPGAALGTALWCGWAGLRRTGWARRSLLTRLGRGQGVSGGSGPRT